MGDTDAGPEARVESFGVLRLPLAAGPGFGLSVAALDPAEERRRLQDDAAVSEDEGRFMQHA